jgi:hypothetical protein
VLDGEGPPCRDEESPAIEILGRSLYLNAQTAYHLFIWMQVMGTGMVVIGLIGAWQGSNKTNKELEQQIYFRRL